jgi:hypothetical protein
MQTINWTNGKVAEVVTVDEQNVLHVTRRELTTDEIIKARNISFVDMGGARAASVPAEQTASFKLFINDFHVRSGSWIDMYEKAWLLSTCHADSVIIC